MKFLRQIIVLMLAATMWRVDSCAADYLSVDVATHRLATALNPALSQGGGNVVWSPMNLRDLLCMAAHGARGKTRAEFENILGLQPGSAWASEMMLSRTQLYWKLKSSAQIYASGRAWVVGGYTNFYEDYETDLRQMLGASVIHSDSPKDVPSLVDRWVSEKTKGHIKSMGFAPQEGANSYACLIAAVYFEGKWQKRFPFSATARKNFTNENATISRVMTMSQEETFLYAEDDQVQSLRMDFGAGDVAMTIVLPRGSNTLASIESKLGHREFTSWVSPTDLYMVDVELPRFSIGSEFGGVKAALIAAGLASLADENAQDFSGITRIGPFHLTEIIHKAGIEVEETGAKAWAASGAGFIGMDGGGKPAFPRRSFHANHPFMFIIHTDRPFIPLFIGRAAQL